MCRECIVESLSHFESADRMCCCFNGEPGLYPQGGNCDTTVSQLLSASTYSASLLKWSQTQHPTVPEALRDWPLLQLSDAIAAESPKLLFRSSIDASHLKGKGLGAATGRCWLIGLRRGG